MHNRLFDGMRGTRVFSPSCALYAVHEHYISEIGKKSTLWSERFCVSLPIFPVSAIPEPPCLYPDAFLDVDDLLLPES